MLHERCLLGTCVAQRYRRGDRTPIILRRGPGRGVGMIAARAGPMLAGSAASRIPLVGPYAMVNPGRRPDGVDKASRRKERAPDMCLCEGERKVRRNVGGQ